MQKSAMYKFFFESSYPSHSTVLEKNLMITKSPLCSPFFGICRHALIEKTKEVFFLSFHCYSQQSLRYRKIISLPRKAGPRIAFQQQQQNSYVCVCVQNYAIVNRKSQIQSKEKQHAVKMKIAICNSHNFSITLPFCNIFDKI